MVVAATVNLATQATAQPFLDCQAELQPLLSAQSALEKVSEIHKAGEFRFPSECLEILMKKNFFEAADYLLEEYYPKTRIDTEIIVKKVERDMQRRQNYLLYTLLENRHRTEQKEIQASLSDEDRKTWKAEQWPAVVEPMLQYAQSRDAIYLRVRMHEDIDGAECSHSFGKHIDVGSDSLQLSVVCFESETDIRKFEKKINFAGELVAEDYDLSEEGDAILILRLPKKGGEVYWPEVLREDSKQSENNIVWRKLNDHYHEEVQDLKERLNKEQAKSAQKKPDDSAESEKPSKKASARSDEEDVVEVDL